MRFRHLAIFAACFLSFRLEFEPAPAQAQKPQLFAQYEDQLIEKVMRRLDLQLELAPDGKLIEQVYIVNHDIILPGDLPLNSKLPWTVLNRLHWRTKDYIIDQELLLGAGNHYVRQLAEETERNLRNYFILAVARVVAVQGSAPDRIGLLVVTKDRWTLRLNTSFLLDNGRLDQLAFSISESNLFGRGKRPAIDFSLDPGRIGIGLSYYDPRIARSRVAMTLSGLLYLNRDSGQVEGGQVQLSAGRPLFSIRTRLGWQANLNYLQDIARFFHGGDIATRKFGDEEVPDIYNRRNIVGNLALNYSDGFFVKANLTIGLRAVSNLYTLPDNFPLVSEATRLAYTATLPRSESWAGPVIALDVFTPVFIKLKNIDTFALTEDYRLGPHLTVEMRFASHLIGLPSDFVELFASFNHQTYRFDNLFDYGASAGGRMQYSTAAAAGYSTPFVNLNVSAYFREVTPRFGPFRLHLHGLMQLHSRDLDNTRLTLGSDNGLRGFSPRALIGNNLYRVNVELRTRAINLWTIHIGGVAFYDGGDAPAGLNSFDRSGNFLAAGFRQDAGIGLRVLFPQFNRDCLRFDLGFPFEIAEGGYAPRFSVEFGQAF